MTKLNKILVGSFISIVTLGGLFACGGPDHHQGFEKGREMFAKRLALSDVQKMKMDTLFSTLNTEVQVHKTSTSKQQFIALLSASEFDESAALATIDGKLKAIKRSAPEVVASIAEFTNSLSQQQRAQLQEILAEGPQRGRHFGRKLF